jgi:streptogramin lyase
MRVILFIALLVNSLALAGSIDSIAGTGTKGYSGDNGPATKAELFEPFHVDLAGQNLFVAEALNHCIRKVDLKTGIITTVAGTGKKGFSGDGELATKATFAEPYAVVVSPEGDLYIVDRLNARIRKVDAKTGILSTFAGIGKKGYSGDDGPAQMAGLVEPNDCFLDGKGGLLIADVADWRIRRVDLKSGTITTFAGSGRRKGKPSATEKGDGGLATKAVIHGARAVCVDGKGNTFICEREGNSIRKVDSKGIITTVAGTGEKGKADGPALKASFNGPKAIRCDKDGNVYIVDTENQSIRKLDVTTNMVSTIAGGKRGPGGDGGPALDAGMGRPHGCVVSGEGVVYIADSENHRVRRVK